MVESFPLKVGEEFFLVTEYRKLADFLWPVGATVLALVGMPLAIEQYPDFFKENPWPLPISLVFVVFCWVVPFFLHERAKRIFGWAKSFGWMGRSVVGLIAIAILVILTIGSMKIFRFHTSHLAKVLRKKEPKPESLEQGREESKKEPPKTDLPAAKPKERTYKVPAAKPNPKLEQQPPQTIIQVAPTFGNLKERAMELSDEIMNDLYLHGWKEYERHGIVSEHWPTDSDKSYEWIVARSNVFRFKFLARVREIRDEFSALHLRNDRLEDGLKEEREMPSPHYLNPSTIEGISDSLKALAAQIKN
jgi:hypothetical protein